MAYVVEFTKQALRDLRSLPRHIVRTIDQKIMNLADEPRPVGVKKLQDQEDLYRIRVGDYRVIYQIFDKKLVVVIVRLGNRKEIYKRHRN